MATVRDVLARKGTTVFTVAPDQSVLEGARIMNVQGIGGLLVVERERLVGMFTERDVLRRVVGEQRDPASTPIRTVMSPDVITTSPDTQLEECRKVMTERRIRHLPVVSHEGIHGLITSGDLLALEVAEHRDTIGHLQSYMFDVRPV